MRPLNPVSHGITDYALAVAFGLAPWTLGFRGAPRTLSEVLAVAFLLLERLATRVRGLVARLDALALRSATGRLAAWLLERPAREGRVSLGMTQGELAEELGTVREVVVRGLRALQRRGAIRALGGGRFEVASREALRAAAEE